MHFVQYDSLETIESFKLLRVEAISNHSGMNVLPTTNELNSRVNMLSRTRAMFKKSNVGLSRNDPLLIRLERV